MLIISLRKAVIVTTALFILTGCQKNNPVYIDNTPQGNFIGKLCNANGSPEKDAVVYLIPDDYSVLSLKNAVIDSTKSNSSGMFAFQVKNNGSFNLLATSGNHFAFKKSISINTDSIIKLPDEKLLEGGSVRGTVNLQYMNNHSSAVIVFPGTNIYAVPTDSLGNFFISKIASGTYNVRFLSMTEGFAAIETTLTVISGKETSITPVLVPKKRYPVIENFKVDYNQLTMNATLSWICNDTDLIDSFHIYCNRDKNISPIQSLHKSITSFTFDHLSMTPETLSYQIAALNKDGWEGESVTGDLFVNKSALFIKTIPVPAEMKSISNSAISSCHINKYGFYVLRFVKMNEVQIIRLDSNFNVLKIADLPVLFTMNCSSVCSDNNGNLFILDQDTTGGHRTLYKLDKDLTMIDSLTVPHSELLNYFSFAVASDGTLVLYNTVGGPFQDYHYSEADTQLTVVKVYDAWFNLLSETSFNDRRTIVDSWFEGDIVSAIIYSDSWSKNRICTFDQIFNCITTNNSVEKINDYHEILKTGFFSKNLIFADFCSVPDTVQILYIYDNNNQIFGRYPHSYDQFFPHLPGKAIFSNYNGTLYSFGEKAIVEYTIDTLSNTSKQ